MHAEFGVINQILIRYSVFITYWSEMGAEQNRTSSASYRFQGRACDREMSILSIMNFNNEIQNVLPNDVYLICKQLFTGESLLISFIILMRLRVFSSILHENI
jgi:hypothetical protein